MHINNNVLRIGSGIQGSEGVKLLIKHHLEFLSLQGGCTGSSESTIVKMPHCWKSYDVAQIASVLTENSEIFVNFIFQNSVKRHTMYL